jgi:hypothetical protein
MAPATLESNLKYIFFFLRKEQSEAALKINVVGPDRLTHATRRRNLSPGDNTVSAPPPTRSTLWRLTTICCCA